MPYVVSEKREELKERAPQEPGELNYWLAMYLWENWNEGVDEEAAVPGALLEIGLYLGYRIRYGRSAPGYDEYNEVMGVLGCLREEARRRRTEWGVGNYIIDALDHIIAGFYPTVGNYEDLKIEQNGDLPFTLQ